ncbi:MAG: DNA polymerase II [Spongiibacteraceae bacterium]
MNSEAVSSQALRHSQGFVLTRQWRDRRDGVELEFWLATEAGPVKLIIPAQQSVFFVAAEDAAIVDKVLQQYSGWYCKDVAMQDFSLRPVKAYYFNSQRTLREAKTQLGIQAVMPFEADINAHDRFLMERSIRGSLSYRGDVRQQGNYSVVLQPQVVSSDYLPTLKVISLDIETAMTGLSLYSIGLYAHDANGEFKKVFIVSTDYSLASESVEVFLDQKQLLMAFFDWLASYDPDIIIGWNVINFDLWFLERVCQQASIPMRFGRGEKGREAVAHWRALDDEGARRAVSIPGRVVLDGIELLKAAGYQYESFSLNVVAEVLLDDGKLIQGSDRGEKITELYQHNQQLLIEYNIQDCKLVWDIFAKTALLDFAVARTRLTGLALDRIGGSVASFDFRYLPLLHRQGFVAPNGHLLDEVEASPGGFVMTSRPGIYQHVAVLDFKSLYPSIIRSFKIDPMGMAIGLNKDLDQTELVPGFKGAWFSRADNILPQLIAELWASRDQAKLNGDKALSQAIKLIMNSFYGVLGSGGCRFFDSKLASSITRRGHQIIQQTAEFIEAQGWSVIYGDTDSVFVWLKDVANDNEAMELGRLLGQQLNQWWDKKLDKEYGIESALEIEFETLYQRFLMPTIRGSELGSKKRYAGVVIKNGQPEIVFKGLENVRTDWTRLARDFQSELYRRVFFDEPYQAYIKQIAMQVLNGEHDAALVYRKRLRRKLDDYRKNIPPHVQAARKAQLAGQTLRRGDWVEYLMTVNGAEPVSACPSLIDYQYYIDRQLAPVADGILHFKGESFSALIDPQMSIF